MYNDLYKKINDVLNCWVNIRNEFLTNSKSDEINREEKEIDIIKGKDEYKRLAEAYDYVKKNGSVSEFCRMINRILDVNGLCMVYSVLLEVDMNSEIIEMMYDWILKADISVFEKETLMHIIRRKCFLTNADIDELYEKCRVIRKNMLTALNEKTNIKPVKIPYNERNHKKIILLSDQILSEKHAPTRIIFSIREVLIELGYDVEVFCLMPYMLGEYLNMSFDIGWYTCDNLIGSYEIEFKSGKVEVFYLPFREENVSLLTQLYKEIEMAKPELIWAIGGECAALDFLSQMTTSLSMPCINGYSNMSSDYMISYMGQFTKKAIIQEEYFKEHNQRTISLKITTGIKKRKVDKNINRSHYNMNDNSIIIALMGNRLDFEITDQFIGIMNEIINMSKSVEYVFIGNVSKIKQEYLSKELHTKLHFMGFVDEPGNILQLCDFMINPPRTGASGGAVISLVVNTPCVSLKNCDVAMNIGNDNCAENIEGYMEMIKEIIQNPIKRQLLLKKEKDYLDNNACESPKDEISNMLERIFAECKTIGEN